MYVKLVWEGNECDKTGVAKYYLTGKELIVKLPSLEKARELEEVLESVYSEGYKEGLIRMQHIVLNAVCTEIYAHNH